MKNTVILGTNLFKDCTEILCFRDAPLLRIEGGPLSVTIGTPEGDPSIKHISVVRNSVESPGDASVKANEESVLVLYKDQVLVTAVVGEEGKIMVGLDLRPLGLNVHTAASALLVGSNTFAGNQFVGGRAISLS